MSSYDTRLFLNPGGQTLAEYGPAQQAVLNRAAFEQARAEISGWPGYSPTPLLPLDGLAAASGVGALWCKHEGYRFGIGSFKPTGPAYAMQAVLKAEVQKAAGVDEVTTQDLVDGRYAEITRGIVVSAATSGNHGRALAWGARTFGCRAVLYMNDGVSAGREAAIAGYGGEVVRVPGAYHQAVARLYADAEAKGQLVIGDPGTARYPLVPRVIMQGYALVADELMAQLSPVCPTHVFVPGGGGILAGACCGHLWEGWGRARPRLVVVEPNASCCLQESTRAARAVRVEDAVSVMDGLVVEEPAAEAFRILQGGAFAFLTVPDQAAVDAMRQAAQPRDGDARAVIGDTGSAGWAGFKAATEDAQLRRALGLDGDSRVAIVVTEGATDPAVYRALTGLDPDRIASHVPPRS